jgi:1-acyl-sn-glycerol-3-phosphate acyltransferase
MNLYDFFVHGGYPLRWWARLEIHGRELLPAEGPVIVVANHDSMIDPLAVAAACHPRRYVRFLAMAELWNNPVLRFVLDGIGQIPTDRRGGGEQALTHAVRALERGEVIGIFPEGGLSNGRQLRARRGLTRLATASPQVPILLAVVTGTGDVVRFPKRPRARVVLLSPERNFSHGDADELGQRLLDQIRAVAPPTSAGRHGPMTTWMRRRRQRVAGR